MNIRLSPAFLEALLASCAPIQLQRHVWVTGLKPEKAESNRELHAEPWPEVNATIKRSNIRNFPVQEREIHHLN